MGTSTAVSEDAQAGAPDAELTLDLAAFPALAKLLAGADGGAIRRELIELQMRSRWQRAARYRRNLLGRILAAPTADGEPVEERVAVVRDISATGARAWVEPSVPLNALAAVTLEVKVPGSRQHVRVAAEMVRVAGRSSRGIEVAFRFTEPGVAAEALSGLLALLSDS